MLVLLFDIDGTLIRSGGAGKLAMERGLKQAFNLKEVDDRVPYAGRTDRAIGFELLRVHGIAETEEHLASLHTAYLKHLPSCLTERGGTICPGIVPILERLKIEDDVHLGLLTGNVEAGAKVKLSFFDLWDYFLCGGYGDAHTNRDDVARTALSAMSQHLNTTIAPEQVWVLGDTQHDVTCARAIGAKAIGVATGWTPKSDLLEADHVFDDFTDHEKLLQLWLKRE